MLKVGSTVLPTPSDVDYEYNKIWSDNTGRLDSGYFVGDLICIKRKCIIKFPPLTPTELSTVRTAFAAQYGNIEITDMGGDTDAAFEAYFGDVKVGAYSWNKQKGIKLAINCTVSMIER